MRLEEHGLARALEELAATASGRYRLTCRFVSELKSAHVDGQVELHLYYIVQEELLNGVNHGKATMVIITLSAEGARLKIEIQDNGAGFDSGAAGRSGMGLRIMHYRASLIGGTLAVQRDLDGGISVVCSVQAGDKRHEEKSS